MELFSLKRRPDLRPKKKGMATVQPRRAWNCFCGEFLLWQTANLGRIVFGTFSQHQTVAKLRRGFGLSVEVVFLPELTNTSTKNITGVKFHEITG